MNADGRHDIQSFLDSKVIAPHSDAPPPPPDHETAGDDEVMPTMAPDMDGDENEPVSDADGDEDTPEEG